MNNESLWREGKSLLFCMTPLLKAHCPKVKDNSSEHKKNGSNSKKIKHTSSVFREPNFSFGQPPGVLRVRNNVELSPSVRKACNGIQQYTKALILAAGP